MKNGSTKILFSQALLASFATVPGAMDESSVDSSQTGTKSGVALFGSGLFGERKLEPVPELDENGEVIKTKELIALEHQKLAASIAEKKKKKWYHANPINKVRERITRKSVKEKRELLQREELMKQDLERFLMELEERHSWLAYELKTRNYSRLVNEERIASTKRREIAKIEAQQLEDELETGLKFFRGNVRGYRRWQSSPAKHWDLTGHTGTVFSCKLSKCLKYILSCSADKTVKLWNAASGQCMKTLYGHSKKVLDVDFHPAFNIEIRDPGIITCGGDGTLRSWNAVADKPVMMVKAHPEAIYKCCFSPEGELLVTCSEDCTIKTWSFPELYVLFTYSYHNSPVTTVRFSPTGRYLVSGSDFGERKLVIWDAKFPLIDQPMQYPHMIFWNEDAMITKILIKAQVPSGQFWLNQNQLSQMKEDVEIDIWLGEQEKDDPVISDSEDEDEETIRKRQEKDNFGADDIKESNGLLLIVDTVSNDVIEMRRKAADEYQPGGVLLVAVETYLKPIAEVYGSVTMLDSRFDCNSTNSGTRIGVFNPASPTPGEPALQDSLALRPPFRVIPNGLKTSDQHKAFIFKSEKQLERDRLAEEARLQKIKDDEKIAFANESDPDKKRAYLLMKKQLEKDNEAAEKAAQKTKPKAVTPAMGKNIIVLRDGIKSDARRRRNRIEEEPSASDMVESAIAVVNEDGLAPIPEENVDNVSEREALEQEKTNETSKDKRPLDLRGVEIIWSCPTDGNVGSAIVTVNVRLEGDTTWNKLTCSLRESPIKVQQKNIKGDIKAVGGVSMELGNIGPNGEKFVFDQEARHNELWAFIRDDNWEGVESMMTKKVIAYYDKKIVARVDKVTELLSSLFGRASKNLIIPNPFVFRPGVTRSSVLVDATEVGSVHRGTFYRPRSHGTAKKGSFDSDEEGYSSDEYSGSSGSYSGSGTDGEGSESSDYSSDSKEDESADGKKSARSTVTVLSEKNNAIKRQKTKRIEVPKFVFATTEGKSRKEIKKLARQEAKGVLELRKRDIAASEEIRNFSIAVTPFEVEKEMLKGDERFKSKSIVASKKVHFEHDEYSVKESKTLLRNGRYGPDEPHFVMDLPEIFPKSAGQAKGALDDHLHRYEKMRIKAHQERIRTADELRRADAEKHNKKRLPEWLRRIVFYSQTEEAAMAKAFEADIALYVLTESAYIAQRRMANAELPGLLPHYPNDSVHGLLDTTGKCRLYSLPPIDTKKRWRLSGLLKDARTAMFEREMEQRSRVGRGKEDYTPPRDDNSQYRLDDKTDMDLVLESVKAASNNELFSRDKKNTDDDDSIGNASSAVVLGSSVLDLDAQSFNNKESRQNPSVAEMEDSIDGQAISSSSWKAPIKKKKREMIEEAGKAQVAKGFTYKRKRFPDGIYMERRPSYPQVPGFESLSGESLRDTQLDMFKKKLLRQEKEERDAEHSKSGIVERPGTAQSRQLDSRGREVTTDGSSGFLKRLSAAEGLDIAHHGTIFDAVFSPSERRLASAGGDKLIKFWDPRDGSMVRSLRGHESEVTALAYSANEAYLVSAGGDYTILVWDLMVNKVTRKLRGHADVINSICISPDCATLVSSSYDWTVRTWKMTPQAPEKPDPPRLVAKSDNMIMISWSAPPCFNESITAQFLQYRIGSYHKWVPEEPLSIPPHYRSKVFRNMPSSTTFRFRLMCENRMGKSEWSNQSKEMSTDMGLPSTCETPIVCGVTPHTMSIFWFSQSIKHYGSAPRNFMIETSGDGIEFGCGCPIMEILSDEAEQAGKELIDLFKEMYRRRVVVGAGGARKDKNPTGISIATPHLKQAIDRSIVKDYCLMSATVTNLTPGHLYRIRVRGINPTGLSDWSLPSLSQSTLAGLPDVPQRPFVSARSLTSITFTWVPPNEGGSALTGYRLWIKHWNYFIDLPRWQMSYVLGRLLPGKPYFVKVLAKNVVGFTEYSEYNEDTVENSYTAIEPPDIPRPPDIVAGTCRSLTINFTLPYHNGSAITSCYVQQRTIDAFSKGPWELEKEYMLDTTPAQVSVVKYIEYEAEEFDTAMDAGRNADGSYNPFDRNKKKKALAIAKVNKYGVVSGPEYVLKKSEGSIMQVEVKNLTADTVYEFRVACRNAAGRGQYSVQSQRAKANRPELPGVMVAPIWDNIAPNLATFLLSVPEFKGGVEISHYTMEVFNLDTSLAITERHLAKDTTFEVLNLTPGARYKARVAAENKVGIGAFSTWTKVVTLPLSAADLIAMGSVNSMDDGRSIESAAVKNTN